MRLRVSLPPLCCFSCPPRHAPGVTALRELAALEDAYRAGVLTKDEYLAKKAASLGPDAPAPAAATVPAPSDAPTPAVAPRTKPSPTAEGRASRR